ncbi:MAG: molecular chaperone DnaJ [Bacteriovoracaceae bacterium]|jgi:molecular chaperone DnaJ|nr:molecular chaperone DnaJ [Bacteriovoracaceae bacterium]
MSEKKDFYDVLGVDRGADKASIKKTYRKLAMKFHPDRNPDDKDAESKLKEINEAASILLDDEKRKQYDQFGHAGLNGQGGFGGFGAGGFQGGDFGDIFGEIFGDFFGGGGDSRRRGGRGSRAFNGDDLQTNLRVTFEEAAFGVEKSVALSRLVSCETCSGKGGTGHSSCEYCNGYGEVRRQQGFFSISQTCPKCRGAGQVIKDPCRKCHGEGRAKKKVDLSIKVPAGIDHGQRLKLSGEGDRGLHGGYPGDLYVSIHLEEHEFFEREEFDVHCIVPISFSQAALGSEIEVPTLTGKVSVKVPAGTQSGKKMRLKNKGITRLGGYGSGDQIMSIHVETPSHLSAEHKEIFKSLAELEQKNCNPMSRGFFDRVREIFQ